MKERLQKVMAQAGIASRRACEELIRERRVKVNGKVATLGQQVRFGQDEILVDGKPIGPLEQKRYLLLHKPAGYITSVKDQFGRKDISDLIPHLEERVYPVGRLDFESEGLLFLTNDGELANKVMHPKYGLFKTYQVQVQGKISENAVAKLQKGVRLEDGITAPAQIRVLKAGESGSTILLSIREGRNRQVRRMCQQVGHPVQRLVRTAIGPLSLTGLEPGQVRFLSAGEVQALRRAVEKGE